MCCVACGFYLIVGGDCSLVLMLVGLFGVFGLLLVCGFDVWWYWYCVWMRRFDLVYLVGVLF